MCTRGQIFLNVVDFHTILQQTPETLLGYRHADCMRLLELCQTLKGKKTHLNIDKYAEQHSKFHTRFSYMCI